jgi:hypothetical protein
LVTIFKVHAFNSDPTYESVFHSHWQAEWAFYNGSDYYAGEDGRYGLGAGEWAPSVASADSVI